MTPLEWILSVNLVMFIVFTIGFARMCWLSEERVAEAEMRYLRALRQIESLQDQLWAATRKVHT